MGHVGLGLGCAILLVVALVLTGCSGGIPSVSVSIDPPPRQAGQPARTVVIEPGS